MTKAKFIVLLCRSARDAVLSHRAHAAEHPDAHRGCLWCEDGRLSHYLSDLRQGYGDDIADRVGDLYERAYLPREVQS